MKKKVVNGALKVLVNLVPFLVATAGLGADKKTWTYELIEVTTSSSDRDKLHFDLNIERLSRGVYAISGEFLLDIDIVEGDSNAIQGKSYRSAQGDNNYKLLPFQIAKSHIFNFLNNYYKDLFMKTMQECSDLPAFEDTFQPPLEMKTYKLENCQFSQEGFPDHLQEGFYKVVFLGSGDVDWDITVIVEVISDL